ncbi:hypothetical protein APHAL10511_006225 [Amanita phalloides]|nr:hypothetical protein APHAL10511_006225 [Amanita phalloides]
MPDYSNYMRQTACVDSLRTILATEGLRSITLGGELSIAAGRFLHMVTNPGTVIELHVDGGLMMGALRPSPSLEWDEDIAAKFANLRSLRLSRLVLSIDLDGNEMSGQMIRTLVMDGVEISQGRLSMLTGEAVEHLEVSGGNAGEQEEEVQEMLARGVRTVRYRVCGEYERVRGVFGRTMERLPLLRGIMAEGVEVDEETVRRRCPRLEWLEVIAG